MARARQTPPPPDPQAQQAPLPPGQVADRLGVGAAAGATLAAVAPPAAGALTAAAITAATAKIIATTTAFLKTRRKSDAEFLRLMLRQDYPQRTPAEIDELVAEEARLQMIFEQRMQDRLERDLPKALALTDRVERQAAVNKILDREQRYLLMRQKAMADRAAAHAEHVDVKLASPEGAYWMLDPTVKQHTPLCVLMGNKVWPWAVLDVVFPLLHAHCACHLLTLREAKERGLVPDGYTVNVEDAVTRARAIVARHGTTEESALPGEIEAFVRLRLEEASRGPRSEQSCHYCEEPAAKSLIWANGSAYIPVCGKHEKTARAEVVRGHDEVDRVVLVEAAKHDPAYERETARIKERAKTAEAKARHTFRAAKWTHPNGHPRCGLCGQEERIGGICNGTPTKAEAEAWVSQQKREDKDSGYYVGAGGKILYKLGEAEYDERFHPRGRHGEWVRKPILDALHKLAPQLRPANVPEHRAPLQERGTEQGRYVWLRGRYVFVPRHRDFSRKLDHVHFFSPAGGTNIYRNGQLIQVEGVPAPPHHQDLNPPAEPDVRNIPGTAEYDPGIKGDPGDAETPEQALAAVAAFGEQEKARQAASARVERALKVQKPSVNPLKVGEEMSVAADMLELHGFQTEGKTSQTGKDAGLEFVHHQSGARVWVEWRTDTYRVTHAGWRPGRLGWDKPPEPIDRTPRTWEEFADEVRSVAYRLAQEHGQEPVVGEVRLANAHETQLVDGQRIPYGDHAGTHNSYTGEILLGPEVRDALAGNERVSNAPDAAYQTTRNLDPAAARGMYASYKVGVHEAIHGAGNVIAPGFYQGAYKAVEEALVEELAHVETARLLRAHGELRPLQFARSNPYDAKVQGTYRDYRARLDTLLNMAKVAPELREDYIRDLRWNHDSMGRLQKLANDVLDANPSAYPDGYSDARGVVGDVLAGGGASEDPAGGFHPILVPDLRDLPSPNGVLWEGKKITPGAVVTLDWGERVEHRDKGGRLRSRWRKTKKEMEVVKVGEPIWAGTKFTMDVRDPQTGLVSHHIHDHSVVAVQEAAGASGAPGVVIDGQRVEVGATISYDGRLDGGRSEAVVTATRHDGTVEAITTENSLKPNTMVLLTPSRMNGVEVVEPGTVTRLPERAVAPQTLGVAADPGLEAEHPDIERARELVQKAETALGDAHDAGATGGRLQRAETRLSNALERLDRVLDKHDTKGGSGSPLKSAAEIDAEVQKEGLTSRQSMAGLMATKALRAVGLQRGEFSVTTKRDPNGDAHVDISLRSRAAREKVSAHRDYLEGMGFRMLDSDGEVMGIRPFRYSDRATGGGMKSDPGDSGHAMNAAIETARAALDTQSEIVRPERRGAMVIVRHPSGRLDVYKETAWERPSGPGLLPWSPPNGEIVARVNLDGTVDALEGENSGVKGDLGSGEPTILGSHVSQGIPSVSIEPVIVEDKRTGKQAWVNQYVSDGGVNNPTRYVYGHGLIVKKDGTIGQQHLSQVMPVGGVPQNVLDELRRVSEEHGGRLAEAAASGLAAGLLDALGVPDEDRDAVVGALLVLDKLERVETLRSWLDEAAGRDLDELLAAG